MNSLRFLARELGVSERTLRRAAREGLVHGERLSPRKFRTTLREQRYLRKYWPLLRQLREALRTEPNVRLAVLYGSAARGQATSHSDIDLLVELRRDDVRRLAELNGRLSRATGRDVHAVRLEDAQESPALLGDLFEHGRVLADRENRWPDLKGQEARARGRARPESTSLEEAAAALDLSRRPLRGRR